MSDERQRPVLLTCPTVWDKIQEAMDNGTPLQLDQLSLPDQKCLVTSISYVGSGRYQRIMQHFKNARACMAGINIKDTCTRIVRFIITKWLENEPVIYVPIIGHPNHEPTHLDETLLYQESYPTLLNVISPTFKFPAILKEEEHNNGYDETDHLPRMIGPNQNKFKKTFLVKGYLMACITTSIKIFPQVKFPMREVFKRPHMALALHKKYKYIFEEDMGKRIQLEKAKDAMIELYTKLPERVKFRVKHLAECLKIKNEFLDAFVSSSKGFVFDCSSKF